MSAFQQALASIPNPPSATPSMSIRGSASGAPSTRGISSALRSAGITKEGGMDVDGGAGRPARTSLRRGGPRAAGPLDQSSRPRPRNDAPYGRPPSDRDAYNNNIRPGPGPPRRLNETNHPASSNLASRISRGGGPRIRGDPRRAPEGTPPVLKTQTTVEENAVRKIQSAKLSEKLKSNEMKTWLRSRVLGEGIMDMSKLPQDEWLKTEGILSPGHRNAPPTAGQVFWKLIETDIQRAMGTPIHTLSLADNNLDTLRQLDRLPFFLQHIRALDLSNNPVRSVGELDILLARGEKKGNATGGMGSLKSLIELKLNGCEFREKMLKEPKGAETYQHEILRRFPGLLVLDGVNLNRIIFPIERKAKVHLSDADRKMLQDRPFTFPVDVQAGFIDNDLTKSFVMAFCAKFFPLFDTNRADLFSAYAPTATLSASINTLRSRSQMAKEVDATRSSRPPTCSAEPWVTLPGRNLFRVSDTERRLDTLKSPGDADNLRRFWDAVPKTKHPLEDPTKWCIDSWVLDGEGTSTKLCAIIQGQFQEMPSATYRSFSRTFILADAPQGSPAQQAGWPCQILSDTLVTHLYMSSGAYDESRSIAVNGVSIQPPNIPSPSVNSATLPTAPPMTQEAMVQQLRQRTGMNENYATMCMAQNGWDFEVALTNFEEIKGTIPAEAFL